MMDLAIEAPIFLTVFLHVFIEPFTPPVPLMLCIISGAIAVIGSFVLITFVPTDIVSHPRYPHVNLLQWDWLRLVNRVHGIFWIQLSSVFIFVVVVIAGFWGNVDPVYNLAPTFVWVIFWVGLTYISAFVGDVWSILNPWKIIFGWVTQIGVVLKFRPFYRPILVYPTKLGAMPGLILFLAFAWIENVYSQSVVPLRISQYVVAYSLVTWVGMFMYGKDTWLRHGEMFSLAFGFLAKFGVIQIQWERKTSTANDAGVYSMNTLEQDDKSLPIASAINCQPWATRLLVIEKVSIWQMFFVLSLLATVTFDGFTGTVPWINIQNYMRGIVDSPGLIGTLGLISSIVLFCGIYFGFAAAMSLNSGGHLGFVQSATTFVYTLIPIALAYHLAHFLLFLLIQGQLMVPLISDPLGLGWDLFGTSNYRINFMLVSDNLFWFTSVIAIVVGHMIAILLSHSIALRVIASRNYAVQSQVPMIILMVAYTIASLWILTQPMYS